MKDVLLVFAHNVSNQKEFDNIIKAFEEKGYIIHLFDGINNESLLIDIFPSIIGSIKKQEGQVDKIVILSNLREIIFSWYRCFNGFADHFVYYIDENNFNFIKRDEHYYFFKQLSDFANIEHEELQGKIYTNINLDNYSCIYYFLLQNYNFKYFDHIDNYDFSYKETKKINKKSYIFRGKEYCFEERNDNSNIIDLNIQPVAALSIDENLINLLSKNVYFIKYFIIKLYKEKNNSETGKYLVNLFKELRKNLNINNREFILKEIIAYIEQKQVLFPEKVYFLSLCAALRTETDLLARTIMKVLVEDEKYLDYHYSMLNNFLYYESYENMKTYKEVYIEQRKEIVKLADYFKQKEKIDITKHRDNAKGKKMKIAIHYDCLLIISHSPTKLCLDLAKNFKKYYDEYDIKIFIEDNSIANSNEVLFPHYYSSRVSARYKEEHNKYLEGIHVDIFYSDVQKSKRERTKEIVAAIDEFHPNVIYSTSSRSVAMEILYAQYPVVYTSHGGVNFTNSADAYMLYEEIKRLTLEINKKINFIDESKIHSIRGGLEFQEPKKIVSRSEYFLKDQDFAIVTVGGRLDAEMTEEFIDMVACFLKDKENAKWLVVGTKNIYYLNSKYKSLFHSKKIVNISYEKDLAALYEICDIYVNPVRKGGGISIAMAMNAGIPVVATINSQDAAQFLGTENCIVQDCEAYLQSIEKLYKDHEYRVCKQRVMKERISLFSYETFINILIDVFKRVSQISKTR